MGKKLLKNVEPSIRAYLGDAFCFSIIGEEAFRSGWVYDKYIHLEYTPEDGQVKYADYGYYDFVPDQGVFIKAYYEIAWSACGRDRICRMVEEMINHGEYFFALWDENVVVSYLSGEEREGIFEHGCFVYGYDDERREFYSQGYLNGEKWERVTIPYDVFYEALSYFPEKGEISFIGYCPVRGIEWRCDVERVRRELHAYGNGKITGGRWIDLAAEAAFFDGICRGKKVHEPSLYCMYEHKEIMRRRIEYLSDRGLVGEGKALLCQIEEIKKGYKKLMLMGVSCHLSRKGALVGQMARLAEKLREDEETFMRKVAANVGKEPGK